MAFALTYGLAKHRRLGMSAQKIYNMDLNLEQHFKRCGKSFSNTTSMSSRHQSFSSSPSTCAAADLPSSLASGAYHLLASVGPDSSMPSAEKTTLGCCADNAFRPEVE